MSRLPPGAKYILQRLGVALVPTAIVTAAVKLDFVQISALGLILCVCVGAPAVFAAQIWWKWWQQARGAARLGARPVPQVRGEVIGNIDILKKMLHNRKYGYPTDGPDGSLDKHGNTFNMPILWDDLIFTIEPENIKTILATDFNNYEKGLKFRKTMESVLGVGVFNADGDMWKFHRSITRPFFTRDRITEFDNFDAHANAAISQMKSRLRAGFAVDAQDAVSRFTLDSATQFLFGHDVCSLSDELPYPEHTPEANIQRVSDSSHPSEAFVKAFMDAQMQISDRNRRGDIWPLFEFFKGETEEPMRVIDAFIKPILQDVLQRHQSNPNLKKDEIGEEDTLLDHLVRQTTDASILKDEILNLLIAGRDTTAGTLTFAINCLARYPHVLHRLRAEILEHVGPTDRPTFDHIREMKYLRAFINEVLRLYPPVPFDARATINETTWASPNPGEKPFYIPASTTVVYSVFMMHRREDLWGPDAAEFDPDRFIDQRLKQYLTKNPFIFLPFNAGPRICLGQQFAYNEVSYMLIKLLQSFSTVELAPDAQPEWSKPPVEWKEAKDPRKASETFFPKTHLTMYSHGGLWVRMSEADQNTGN